MTPQPPENPPPFATRAASPAKHRGCWIAPALLVVLACCLVASLITGYLVYDNLVVRAAAKATPTGSTPALVILESPQSPSVAKATPTASPRTFRFEQVVDFTNNGPEMVERFEIRQGLPVDLPPFQKALFHDLPDVEYSIQEGVDGSRMAYIDQDGLRLQPGDVFSYTLRGEVTLHPDRLDVPTACSGDLPQAYLQPEEYIESDHPRIRQIAADLSAGRPDVCARVRAFYDYARDAVRYVYHAEDRGAITALETGEGDCTDISFLMIALSRAAGIPARRVQGFNINPGKEKGTYVFETHQWAEVYLPGTGWIPADPTYAQNEDVPYTYLGGYLQDHILLSIDDFNFFYNAWSATGNNSFTHKVHLSGERIQ